MRRTSLLLLAATLLGAPLAADAQSSQPPHAWLFGTWTGGLFPAAHNLSPQACFSQPVVIFTKDLVMRPVLTELSLVQREIETVRASPNGLDFRFVGSGGSTGLLGGRGPQFPGFGCESADVLHVQKRGENEITFPGCTDFPNPLVRCQTR